MALSAKVVKQLEKIVGKDNCSVAAEDQVCYAYDATRKFYRPEAVVFPATAAEVAAVLSLAGAHGIGVTPRGAGSGMSGGALPVKGGIAMVMTRFNRVLSIDRDNFIARVEPGVITGDFQKAVAEADMFYPPDPSSADISTLGGNLAECAGGPKAVKYGVTRDYVLGLEVVLPTGEIVSTGVQTAKGVVGYDLTRLIVGSEGTLAVITEMTLRLVPRPEAVKTLTAVFDKMDTAAAAVSEIIRRGIVPRAIEYMDKAAIGCVEKYLQAGLPTDAEAILLIEVDGTADAVDHSVGLIENLLYEQHARRVDAAGSPAEAAALWKARKSISPSLFAYGSEKINEDIVVPRNRIPDMVKKIRALSRQTGLTMVSFGHAGDGNIHFNIMFDKDDAGQRERAGYAVETVFDYTLALGGTISGEHGVGTSKAAYMHKEIKPEALALMKRVKAAFDPAGILNPGKMLLSGP
ncbi:MAG: FAD-binding oxidoreductase [Thermodesulfobacteriota bacterium]